MEGGTASCCSSPPPGQQLPPALQVHVLSFLPPNDLALSGRLVSTDAADALNKPQHCTASLSQPLPPHTVAWAQSGCWQQHVRQLTFLQKLQLLCTAAASGSEVNLEVAWALLQPSVFPELLQGCCPQHYGPLLALDPGAAAVKACHPPLLCWLLRHCPRSLVPETVLEAAAEHCDLAGLQLAWRLLQEGAGSGASNGRPCPALSQGVLDAAAGSGTSDAVAKMEWVLAAAGEGACSLQGSTAAAAAGSGDLDRLRWLCDRGCSMEGRGVLQSALQHADLAVAQWLVDEAGCELPYAGRVGRAWASLFLASARSADCVPKWQWLCDRGAWVRRLAPQVLRPLAWVIVHGGRVEGLRGLQSFPAMQTAVGREALQRALNQAWGPRCVAMAMQLQQEGYVLTHNAYLGAACAGDLDMLRWLACVARVPIGLMGLYDLVRCWPNDTAARSRDLLQAVQLLVGEAGHQAVDKVLAVGAAVRAGNMAVAQYLLQLMPGYQPGAQLLHDAVESGCEALLEWVVEQPGCQADLEQPLPHLYELALRYRDRGTLTALRRLGVPWGAEDMVVRAVREGCEMPVLRWLVEQGAPVGSAGAMEVAVTCSRRLSAEEGAWLRGLAAANGA